jgi:AraC-like DNA-binding protein
MQYLKGHTMTVIETRKTIRTASFGVTRNHFKKFFTCLATKVSVCVNGVNYFDNIHSFLIIAATAEAVHCSIRPLRRLFSECTAFPKYLTAPNACNSVR